MAIVCTVTIWCTMTTAHGFSIGTSKSRSELGANVHPVSFKHVRYFSGGAKVVPSGAMPTPSLRHASLDQTASASAPAAGTRDGLRPEPARLAGLERLVLAAVGQGPISIVGFHS